MLLGRFNEQAGNSGLVVAVLVAGLYPNVLLASDSVFDRHGNPQLTTIDDHEVREVRVRACVCRCGAESTVSIRKNKQHKRA